MTIRTMFAIPALATAGLLFGCTRGSQGPAPSGTDSPAAPVAQEQPAVQPQPADPSAQAAPPAGTHVGEKTKEVLDAREAVKDPNWTVVASDSQAVQGFTIAGTAYNRAAALAGTADLEKWIQLEQAGSESGAFPSYAALKRWIDTNPVDMPRLREYQHYGYDETTGQIEILENRQEKEARRGELGLSPGE